MNIVNRIYAGDFMPSKHTNDKRQLLFIHSAGSQGLHNGSTELVAFLQNKLGDECRILFPHMPQPENPSYIPWKITLEKEIALMNNEFLLVGHSLGASVILKYLSENEIKKSISGLFLIAAPFWGEADWEIDEYVLAENFGQKLPPIQNIFLYHSVDDPIVPFSHMLRYYERLPDAVMRRIQGIRHSFGTGLPEIITDIKNLNMKTVN